MKRETIHGVDCVAAPTEVVRAYLYREYGPSCCVACPRQREVTCDISCGSDRVWIPYTEYVVALLEAP